MRSTKLLALVLALACAGLPTLARAEAAGAPRCLVLDIHRIGPARLAALAAVADIETWIELDEELFVCGSDRALEALEKRAPVRRTLGRLDRDRLRLAHRQSRAELEERGLRVIAAGGLFALVQTPDSLAAPTERPGLLPLRSARLPLVLARQLANQPARARSVAGDGTVAGLVAEIDSDRWFADVETLATYNRFTGGAGIHDAHAWLMQRFDAIPGLKVESHHFLVQGIEVANVVAVLRGSVRRHDWYIVGGHYDSTSEAPLVAAPGAEDNASGCAGVLEMARIFAAHPPEATILFLCYAGEEQGLFGSSDHVADLLMSGDSEKVGAMLNLDMIGFTSDPDLDCLLQSNAQGWELIGLLADSAARHTDLRLVTSINIGGSDHVPYAAFGIPAVLSIENDWNLYPHYHRTTDTPDHLNPEMAAEILRMNVGALARFTGNSDVSGCLKLDDEPLLDVGVTAKQSGASSQKTSSDRRGCFAIDPVVREKKFKLRLQGEALGAEPGLSGCVRLLGESANKRRVILRQPGEATQKTRSDDDGCFAFEAAGDKSFKIVFKGPRVPAND